MSHSIIGHPFPNDGHVPAAFPLDQLIAPSPHLLDHYPRSLGLKAILTLAPPVRYPDALWMTNSPQFRYCFTIFML